MKRSDRVLVVDGLRETADVLRTVLEPRGLDVARIRGNGVETPPDLNAPAPKVVVFHLDDDALPAESQPASWSHVPRVIISSDDCTQHPARFSGDHQQFLQKPFQYGELVLAIERLLDGAAT